MGRCMTFPLTSGQREIQDAKFELRKMRSTEVCCCVSAWSSGVGWLVGSLAPVGSGRMVDLSAVIWH